MEFMISCAVIQFFCDQFSCYQIFFDRCIGLKVTAGQGLHFTEAHIRPKSTFDRSSSLTLIPLRQIWLSILNFSNGAATLIITRVSYFIGCEFSLLVVRCARYDI